MTKYKVIYEPKGKAAEYGELAVNLYNGCSHGCVYCYAPSIVRKSKEDFFENPQPRKEILANICKDIKKMKHNDDYREVFLCFTCDPYQEIDMVNAITVQALNAFLANSIPVRILTKSSSASKDFWLMRRYPHLVQFGMTLVFDNEGDRAEYEPCASSTESRIETIEYAKRLGIKTWVSLEPVWTPEDAFALIERTHGFVDEYRIGKLNYHPQAKNVDWKQFAIDVSQLCESLGCNYVLKEDLKKLL